MSIKPINISDFELLWRETDRTNRYRYRLNRGVLRLYSFLFGLFWSVYGFTIWGNGFSLTLGLVGGIVGVVFVFALYNLLYWRHFSRVSGIVIQNDQLVWRNGRSAWCIPWAAIDFEASGLTDHSIGSNAIEHHLMIEGKRLDIARMHVEMPRMRDFMAIFLKQMVEHGQITRKTH